MISEKASGADNQQERLQAIDDNLGHYLSGFADGEGSFNISLIKRPSDYKNKWKIVASFNISQRDSTIPKLFQKTLGCGTIRYRRDGVCYFEVCAISDLNEIVRYFFKQFPLRSVRQAARFEQLMIVTSLMAGKEHLTPQGLSRILLIREEMTSKRKRKYVIADVL